MARTQEPTLPPDLESTRRHLDECRRRLDRIAQRYGELEEALATLESLANNCIPSPKAEPVEDDPEAAPRPRQPR